MLIIVKDGDVDLVLQSLLDLEAARRRDVLEVDAAEGGRDQLHGLDDLVGVVGAEADRERIDVGELLEQHRLALHHRHRGLRADVSEAQHGASVGDDRDRVLLDRELERLRAILGDLGAHPRHAGRVGHREVVARLQGVLVVLLDLAAAMHRHRAVDVAEDARPAGGPDGAQDLLPVALVARVDRELAHSLALAARAGHEIDALKLAAGLGDLCGQLAQRLLARVELDAHDDGVLGADGGRGGHGGGSYGRSVGGAGRPMRLVVGMRLQLASPDELVAQIAARQHGIVTFEQLLGAGLSQGGIKRRVAAGRLHRVYRGVYAVGHPGLSNEGRWSAAVAACGKGSVLSHRSAAELWTLLAVTTGPVHVTVAGRSGRARRRGLVIHHSPSLTARDVTRRNRIRVTTPAQTIADLRRSGRAADLRRALRKAAFLGLDVGGGERVSEGEGGIGTGRSGRERSDLERLFLRLCDKRGLPMPHVNVPIGPYTVDFLWPKRRLAVETDGWEGHRGRQAFEDDRARDAYLRLRGLEVLRFTWRQITEDPHSVVAVLRRYLS